MFKKTFKIVEIREDKGTVITHYLRSHGKELKKDIEAFKSISSKYEVFGKEGMTIWI